MTSTKLKKRDEEFLVNLLRGREEEVPPRFYRAIWRCKDAGMIRFDNRDRDGTVCLTRRGRLLAEKLSKQKASR